MTRAQKPAGMRILTELTKGAKKWSVEVGGQKATTYAVMIGADLAERVIEHCNVRNRTVRQNKVLEWANRMRRGEWQLRGEIVLTDAGELIDGQHRLLALVEVEEAQPFFVRVIPAAAAKKVNRALDDGVIRNLPDYLHFNQIADAARVAPLLVYERNARVSGSPLQHTRGEKPEYLALAEEIGEETFKRLFDMMPRGLHVALGVNRGFLDWFGLHAMTVDRDGAELFFSLLGDPSQLRKTDPPYVLREELIDIQRRSAKVSLVQQAHMTAKAWRIFGEGQEATRGKIRHRVNEDWPGVFGE